MSLAAMFLFAAIRAMPVDADPSVRADVAVGRFADARRVCSDAVAANPSDVDNLLCVARLSGWLGDYAAAVRGYDAALALSPGNTDALTGQALVWIWRKRFPPAQALLEQARVLSPANVDIELAFARLEQARGRLRNAKRHAQAALLIEAANPEARALLRGLEDSPPVLLRFGIARDSYSFANPGSLESTSAEYRVGNSRISLSLEKSAHFGEKTSRGGAGYLVTFHRRWTARSEMLIGPSGDAFPSLDLKAGIAARIGGNWVVGADYRRLNFFRESVDVAGPSVEYYWKKVPVWVQLNLLQSSSTYLAQPDSRLAWSLSSRMNAQCNRRLLLRAGFAAGDENFIDWTSNRAGAIREKSVFGGIECRLTRRYTAGLSYGFSETSNQLTRRSLGVNLILRP